MLVDSNLLIYAGKGDLSTAVFSGQLTCSVITTIEALGYYNLPVSELRALERLLARTVIMPLTDDIVNLSIRLRQARKMKLGDAIIAATALVNDLELWTNNTKDFKAVDGLRLHNPLS